jgi:MFS family permease
MALAVVVGVQVCAALVVALVMRDYPAEVGLAPYGETRVESPPPVDRRLAALWAAPFAALQAAWRRAPFWVLFGTFFVCGFSTNGLMQTHWISLCGDYGILPVGAARVLATVGLFDFIGTLLSGYLTDRFDHRRLLAIFYALRGLSLLCLPFTGFDLTTLWFFAVFYGLDWVATVPPTVRWAIEAFGREQAPIVFGWIFTGHQLGAATAAYSAGLIRTLFGTYLPALNAAGIACLLAAALVLVVSPRRFDHEPSGAAA